MHWCLQGHSPLSTCYNHNEYILGSYGFAMDNEQMWATQEPRCYEQHLMINLPVANHHKPPSVVSSILISLDPHGCGKQQGALPPITPSASGWWDLIARAYKSPSKWSGSPKACFLLRYPPLLTYYMYILNVWKGARLYILVIREWFWAARWWNAMGGTNQLSQGPKINNYILAIWFGPMVSRIMSESE